MPKHTDLASDLTIKQGISMSIDYPKAYMAATDYLKQNYGTHEQDIEIAEYPIEKPYGWIFWILGTRQKEDAPSGYRGPLFVKRDDGTVHPQSDFALDGEEAINLFEATKVDPKYWEPEKVEAYRQINFFIAASTGDVTKLAYLLKGGMDVNIRNRKRETALYLAAVYDQIKAMKLLLSYGANIDLSGPRNWTPLLASEAIGCFRGACFLVKYGANANATSDDGGTPLSYAMHFDSRQAVRLIDLLIRHGANVNQADNEGFTPLIIAVVHDNYPAVKRLCYYGADVNIRNHKGDTALDWSQNEQITKLLNLYRRRAKPKRPES